MFQMSGRVDADPHTVGADADHGNLDIIAD